MKIAIISNTKLGISPGFFGTWTALSASLLKYADKAEVVEKGVGFNVTRNAFIKKA